MSVPRHTFIPSQLTVTSASFLRIIISGAGLVALGCSEPSAPKPVATSIAFVVGASQRVLAGTTVPLAPVAQVQDQFGKGMPGVNVVFSVVAGGGSVAGGPVVTDATGNATAPAWTLGKSAVPQTLRAVADTLSAVLDATIMTSYNVDLRFFGPPMPAAAAAAFTAAAARIEGSVTGDVPNVGTGGSIDVDMKCGVTGVMLTDAIIDDVVIYASVAPIDGVGKVLASSGPCLVRNSNDLPVVGVMQFDSDDIQRLVTLGSLQDVVQHEMLHVIGIGTIWGDKGLLAGASTSDSRFTGALGVSACVSLGGSAVCPGSVPVENIGGVGTADGHWREATFGNELMTGFLNAGTNPFSTMSIQSLADLGYVVNTAAADAYRIPGTSIQQTQSATEAYQAPAWEKIRKPRMLITKEGRLSAVRQ